MYKITMSKDDYNFLGVHCLCCNGYPLFIVFYCWVFSLQKAFVADDSGSPVPQQWQDDEITAVITPYSKVDNSFDSGFKSQPDISVSIILLLLMMA